MIRVQEAAGQVLCHDITQIIPGVAKNILFPKGHVIGQDDLSVLLRHGKDHIYVLETNANMLHENDAAEFLRSLCEGQNMHATPPKEGKIELIADMDGLLMIDLERMNGINRLGEMIIASRLSGFPVKKGDKLCGMRIIPLFIEKEKMERSRQLAGNEPLIKLLPLKPKKYGLIVTGNEVFHRRIEDNFSPVIQKKLSEYNCEMIARVVLDDSQEKIAQAIKEMLDAGATMVFCTGGMSVDPDDTTPKAIRDSANTVVSYGAPVLPGAMFMLAYTTDGRPICGLPGCVMYSQRTVFDLVLPYLLADVPVTAKWLAGLGNGGLCLNCPDCHFPNCSFGKGA